jgi:hypothetical protein
VLFRQISEVGLTFALVVDAKSQSLPLKVTLKKVAELGSPK